MKLISKISRYFIFTSIPIFIVISIGLYFVIDKILINETDEQLVNISKKVTNELWNGKITDFAPFIEVSRTDKVEKKSQFEDVVMFTQNDDEGEQYRQLTTFVNLKGTYYKVITRVSLIEKEDMLFTIMSITIAAIFFLVLIMYVTNKSISKNILKDFYNTLKKLENFSLKNDIQLQLTKSNVEEFEQLNKSLLFLAEKAKSEYRSLKEFSEEINHELQTPLAITKSKLEILLQNEKLNKDDLTQVNAALTNLNRLEQVNKSILLLNKLEHKNLFDDSEVKIADEVKNVLANFSDFIKSKNIIVEEQIANDTFVEANPSLINILFTNLLSNAIKHNNNNGKIIIELKGKLFKIKNTGNPLQDNPQKMFNRFVKSSNRLDSVGLGLTIVKRICDLYNYRIEYEVRTEWHEIKLFFS